MTPSPNHTAGVPHRMDQHTKISPTNQSSNISNGGSTTQNGISGISEIPIGRTPVDFSRISERLKTFDNWPVSFMNINDLAAAGFYYTNKADIVRCPFCSIEIGRWEEGDDPLTDHRKHSPHCRYVLQKVPSTTGDTPLNNLGIDVCGAFSFDKRKPMDAESNAKEIALQKLGIHTEQAPAVPKFSTLEARLRSFETWPISMKLKPNDLSEAGFYYTGKGDQTVCFHCGGGLKDWEETDSPWVEHAKHFSKCNYVLLIKGKEFVDEVCGKQNQIQSLTREEMNAVVESHSRVVPIDPAVEKPPFSKRNTNEEQECSKEELECSKEDNKDTNMAPSVKAENDSMLCKVCFTEERNAVFLPCGHLVVCGKCGIGLKTCVVCRKPCEARVRVFLS